MAGHHHHQHHHPHGDGFDWEAMADRLELDAAVVAPIVPQALAHLGDEISSARIVLDVGCGPGTVALSLARALPAAHITAIDSNEALLGRVRHAAEGAGLAERVDAVHGDLEAALPTTEPADLVWAGMVLHHVARPVESLERLHAALRPGGALVMIEFGAPPTLLLDDAPALAGGAWTRFQAATSAVLNERLGLDPVTVDWPALLGRAGFADVVDLHLAADHVAPLQPVVLAWFDAHVRRGLEMAEGRLSEADVAALRRLADDAPTLSELAIRAHRRVLVAHRN